MSQLYRNDAMTALAPILVNGFSQGFVCVSADPSKAPFVVHAADGAGSPFNDGAAPIWDFATQGDWSSFADANPTVSPSIRLHQFGGETIADGIQMRDPRFYWDAQPTDTP